MIKKYYEIPYFPRIIKTIPKNDLLKLDTNLWKIYFLNFLDYFELTYLKDDIIEFRDLEDKNKTFFRSGNIDLFENYNFCAICLEKKIITKDFCINIHSDGICNLCYIKLEKCCICRDDLL
jgi:hypothetical protein